MQDALMLWIIAFVTPLLMIAAFSSGLRYFVALSSPPTQRAAWTAGSAYLITTTILIFVGISGYELLVPLAALPGGLIAFWFWRLDFRRAWIEDPESIPDGLTLANDDWRIGVLQLLALIILAIGIALLRVVMRSF
jgi:hypothetical protein